MTPKESGFAHAQNLDILVFPTQSSADSWALAYARSFPGKVAFADTFISWDTFRDSCRTIPSDLQEATYVNRLIFTTEFLKSNALNALCPSSYPESKALFTDETASALPDFPVLLENPGNTSKEILSDIQKITEAYSAYLRKNSLYEKAWIKPSFTKAAAEGKTVLVFPRSYNDKEVERALEAGIKTIEPSNSHAEITVYTNSLQEIRKALDSIRKLLSDKTPASDIKITISGTEMLAWLETEAYRRNIPLDVKIGKPLAEYPAGAMFKAIENVSSSLWSIESLQALLLNPAFPLKNREAALNLVRLGIKLKVVPLRKAQSWISKLGKTDEETRQNTLEYLITLRDRIEAITGSGDVNSLREAIHAFEDDFLGEKDALQTKVYSRCMEELENLASASQAGLPEKPFTLFVRILSKQRYMPKTDDNGVAVYLYPSNAGMTAPYHFALGFDDEKTRRERTESLFSDAEGLQIGDDIIASYEAGGAVFSCATQSYTGRVTEPAYFAVKSAVLENRSVNSPDVFSYEESLWERDLGTSGTVSATELQKKWFESLDPSSKPENNELFDKLNPSVEISATELNNFIKCPYRWYCESHYGLNLKRMDYEVDMEDHINVGNMVHNCLEEWLNEEHDFSKLREESSRRKLEAIFEKHFTRYTRRADAPYEPQLRRLTLTLPMSMYCIATAKGYENLVAYHVSETEKEFNDGVLRGRIDCVLQDENGNTAVLDFKKGEADKTSVQLQFYSYGLDEKPVRGAFFSVKDRKFAFMWEDTDALDNLVKDLDEKVENMKQTLKTGRFEATPSDNSCNHCDYRSICRKRFVIK